MISCAAIQAMVDSGMSAQALANVIMADNKEVMARMQRTRDCAAQRQRICRERRKLSRDVTSVTPVTVTIENKREFPVDLLSSAINDLSATRELKMETDLSKKERESARKKDLVEGQKPSRAVSGNRGCRLPADWMPSLVDQDEALHIGLTRQQIQVEGEKFRDYWHSRAGPGSTKIDWSATWRNWCRKANEDNRNGPKGPNGHGRANGHQVESASQYAFRIAAEVRERERAAGIGRPDDFFRGN